MEKIEVSAAEFAMVKDFPGGYRAPKRVVELFEQAHAITGNMAIETRTNEDLHNESPADYTHGAWEKNSHWEWISRGDMWARDCLTVVPAIPALSDIDATSRRFWARFNALATAAAQTEDGKVFIAAGFKLHANGGGLTAWRKEINAEWEILITNEGGDSHDLEDESDSWLVVMHDTQGEFVASQTGSPSPADAIATANAAHLARAFADELESEIGEIAMNQVRRYNVVNVGDIACASHDFCDANMTMHDAFKSVMGCEPEFLNDPESALADEHLQLWNAAWSIAKREFLTLKESN